MGFTLSMTFDSFIYKLQGTTDKAKINGIITIVGNSSNENTIENVDNIACIIIFTVQWEECALARTRACLCLFTGEFFLDEVCEMEISHLDEGWFSTK